jgi:hypothetical protein
MARVRYVVSPHHGAWLVQQDGDRLADFPTQVKAKGWVRELARKGLEGGRESQVVIQGRDGRIREQRSYGHDPRRHPG